MTLKKEPLIIADGGCGTTLQELDLPASAWGRYEGCNEYLNLSAPEAVQRMHRSFIDAGAMMLETNTFGATSVVLAEYGLESRTEEINRAAVENARAAGARYVAGSVGPTTKLPSLGHITYTDLSVAVGQQVTALAEAGVDALIVETCQDLKQIKIALVSTYDVLEALGREVPVLLSVTIETTGTLLAGSDIAAVVTAVEPYPLFSLGLNCATGPGEMKSPIRYLSRNWPGRISCIPNAGLPAVEGDRTVYKLSPEAMAAELGAFVKEDGVSIVGGCCGTKPEHIRALVRTLEGVEPARRDAEARPALSSLFQSVEIKQEIPPLLIGERANTNGSKKFRKSLLADDYQGALKIAKKQEREGAHALDLCTAYAGRDESKDLGTLVQLFAETIKAPMIIDSTTPECIEESLKIHAGRCLINSIHLEDGGANLERVCRYAKRYGAAVVALAIHEKGMAMTAEEKEETASRIFDLAVNRYGLRPSDLLFDPLTFTVGSGDPTLKDAAMQTLEGIKRIKARHPGVFTLLGVSNISFGLPPAGRKILNSVFLHEAVRAGLDAAIVDVAKVVPFNRISEEDREACQDLLYNRSNNGDGHALERFIEHFKDAVSSPAVTGNGQEAGTPEERLANKLIAGDKEGTDAILTQLIESLRAEEIINTVLVPAMRTVGDHFARGEMLLPFVLKSAEVMKKCVTFLEPHMESKDEGTGLNVLLATVQGDVHDIGKNLVDIILSNNGYQVHNLGTKVPAEVIIAKAKEVSADVIGLSGLLVKSALKMRENLEQFRDAGLEAPVLLGGAALTHAFVAEECVPRYASQVVYCPDAFSGLTAMQRHEEGTLTSTTWKEAPPRPAVMPGPKALLIERNVPVPEPPFLGCRHVEGIDAALLYPYLNEQALFRGRWGYRRAKLSAERYRDIIIHTVRPLYEEIKKLAVDEAWFEPKVAYGYFRCYSEGNDLVIESEGGDKVFSFPRQKNAPNLCISDYFRTLDEGGDVAGFFVVSLGDRINRKTKQLFEESEYHHYLMVHGFSVEVTDALAEYWHEEMRKELGIGGNGSDFVNQGYQGSRYGFGYPACPDLEAHIPVFELLNPEALGVSLTESLEMVPEQTTSAIVVHHPQAKYFAV
jgi:5-methyltetrahydrofolate--homocysteine methyltransferase